MKNTTSTQKFFGLGIKTYITLSLIVLQLGLLAALTPHLPDIEMIIDRLDEQAYETITYEATMTVTNNLGVIATSVQSYALRDGDSLFVITDGPDRGQKMLRQGESVFLYFPDAEELLRLQGSALRDSIGGSDLSYEDVTGENNTIRSKFTYEFLGTEAIDGNLCYHILLTAKSRKETYQKQEVFVDAELFLPRKTILYSASGKALRERTDSGLISVGEKNFFQKSLMRDLLKNNSSTLMEFYNIEINTPIDPELFSRENLTW